MALEAIPDLPILTKLGKSQNLMRLIGSFAVLKRRILLAMMVRSENMMGFIIHLYSSVDRRKLYLIGGNTSILSQSTNARENGYSAETAGDLFSG